MLLVVALLQALVLLVLIALLLRKPPVTDERLLRLPEALTSLQARADGTESTLRNALSDMRREQAESRREQTEITERHRAAADTASRALREEVNNSIALLQGKLIDGLNGFRNDNGASSEQLRKLMHTELTGIGERLTAFFASTSKTGLEARDALHTKLTDLSARNTQSYEALRESMQGHQERMRAVVEERLNRLNADNTEKLEQMRATVDEKLNATLNERLTTSFGQVTTHLGEVQKGLGEMREFATGVSDLKRVFSNVKARGVVGEFQLGMQLEQMFSREQYEKNVEMKPGSNERVEYALKVPQGSGTAWFAIDSKFPREDWERLQDAREAGLPDDVKKAGDAFDRAIRTEGKRICEKYIAEPYTLPHAILFLPTEGLYAEVMQRPGLQSDLQQQCNVTIAGPSTLMAILTSFRMGFHTIAMERKGREIEKVLGRVKTEFNNFGGLLEKAEKQVGTVQNTLGSIRGKTTTITRSLKSITEMPLDDGSGPRLIDFEEISGVAPLLAAATEE